MAAEIIKNWMLNLNKISLERLQGLDGGSAFTASVFSGLSTLGSGTWSKKPQSTS